MLKVGDRLLLKQKASANSLVLWRGYTKKYPYLICPCNIPTVQRLVVKYLIGTSGLLVQYENDERMLSIVRVEDVKKV